MDDRYRGALEFTPMTGLSAICRRSILQDHLAGNEHPRALEVLECPGVGRGLYARIAFGDAWRAGTFALSDPIERRTRTDLADDEILHVVAAAAARGAPSHGELGMWTSPGVVKFGKGQARLAVQRHQGLADRRRLAEWPGPGRGHQTALVDQ